MIAEKGEIEAWGERNHKVEKVSCNNIRSSLKWWCTIDPYRLVLALSLSGFLLLSQSCQAPVAPDMSSIRLDSSAGTIRTGQRTQITATVTESDGDPAVNGTIVVFQTSLGSYAIGEDPTSVARTQSGNGVAKIDFSSNQSGIAKIVATSGTVVSNTLEIQVLPGAAKMTVIANPLNLPCGGGTTNILVSVQDLPGIGVSNEQVLFEATEGTLQQIGVFTDENGQANNTLTTAEDSIVTIRVFNIDAQTIEVDVADCP